MKNYFTLVLLLMLGLPLYAANLCDSLERDLKALQKAESNFVHPQSGEKILTLQDQYDQAIAEYTIYKGIDELRSSYLKFNDDVSSLNLGHKPEGENQVISSIKDFFSNLFAVNKNPKIRELQQFRQDIREGMTATAGILVMEDLIDQLFVNESLQKKLTSQNLNYSGDEFLTELKIQCDRTDGGKNAYDQSPLCQEVFTKDQKGNLSLDQQGHSRKMVLGFFDAYKALLRGGNKDEVKSKLADYKKTLLAQMPKSAIMQKQLQLVKNVDKQLESKFENYRQKARTNPNQSLSSSDLAEIRAQVQTFTGEMSKLSADNYRLLGAKEREATAKATRESRIKTQFGNLQEVIDGLAQSTDQTQDQLISSMMGNYEINKARKAIATQLENNLIEERKPEDEYRKAFDSLGVASCKGMTFYADQAKRLAARDSLYLCLSDLNKATNTPISEKIVSAKNRADELKRKIKDIEKDKDYNSFNYLKKATLRSIRTNCSSLKEKNCRPEGQNSVLLDREQNLTYLTNSMGEIISLFDDADVKSGSLSSKEMRERATYCQDKEYSALAPTICKTAQTFEKQELVNSSFHFSEDTRGMKSDPMPRPTNTEIWISAAKTPVQSMVPFLLQYRNTNTAISYATEYGKQQKAYNYVMTEYWKEYYQKFPAVGLWGTSNLYPTYYNPLNTSYFNYGSTSYFGASGSSFTGFNFSN